MTSRSRCSADPGYAVYHSLSNDYEGVSSSISTGKPIVLNGNSKYSQDMKALGALVTGIRRRRTAGLPLRALPRRLAGCSAAVQEPEEASK